MTTFTLKMIALACMVIDHIGAVFYMDTPEYFRYIGRISFPIFAFLIAEGCSHTKDMKKYLVRLGAFALISEVPFDLAFATTRFSSSTVWGSINFLHFTNVFYTLFLGALAVYGYQLLYKRFSKSDEQRGYAPRFVEDIPAIAVGCIPVLPAAFLAARLGTDYSSFGVVFIFCIYIVKTKTLRMIVVAAGVIFKYGSWIVHYVSRALSNDNALNSFYFPSQYFYMLLVALLSVVCIFFYDGKRGRSFKWAFYVIYPAHLLLLSFLYWIV